MTKDKLDLSQFDYDLPSVKIAQYPAAERDISRLLVSKGNKISSDVFRNIEDYLPADSLVVFNNTRVIRARILFRKETGATIEVLCLEPVEPAGYEQSFGSEEPVEWKCIVGNLKKWKDETIKTSFISDGMPYVLTARKIRKEGEAWQIQFDWGSAGISFGNVIEAAGDLPLPPYINRSTTAEDNKRYQTVYSRISGSVAAPTAGLHFTGKQFEGIKNKGIKTAEVTLHVGAGTFQPVKSRTISEHEMHCEHFSVARETVELLKEYDGRVIAIGTTTVRTLESLYRLGIRLKKSYNGNLKEISLGQWEAYDQETDISVKESMEVILNYMDERKIPVFDASTKLIIIPGFEFRMIKGIVTNFHQPQSTLLLLVAAWTGKNWKEIYDYALDNDFRFLSYGDCSLLLK